MRIVAKRGRFPAATKKRLKFLAAEGGWPEVMAAKGHDWAELGERVCYDGSVTPNNK